MPYGAATSACSIWIPRAAPRRGPRLADCRCRWRRLPSIDRHGSARWPARAGELTGAGRLVVLDLPPLLLPVLASALIIADVALIPLTPSALDVAATGQTLRMIRMARESRPGRRPKGLLVLNRVDPQRRDQPATDAALAEMTERWAPPVRQHADHVEAFATGDWIGGHVPDSPATLDILALAEALEDTSGHPAGHPFRSSARYARHSLRAAEAA